MPVVLILAFAASLGIHAALLFGTTIELSPVIDNPPLLAELKPQPMPPRQIAVKPEVKKTAKAKTPQRQAARVASASPVSVLLVTSGVSRAIKRLERSSGSPAMLPAPPKADGPSTIRYK